MPKYIDDEDEVEPFQPVQTDDEDEQQQNYIKSHNRRKTRAIILDAIKDHNPFKKKVSFNIGNDGDSEEGRSGAKSPGPKVTVVPRKGSFETRASFRNIHVPQTPEEKRKVMQKRSGPASRNTVITVAGLFTVGIMFISSGIIVLCSPNNQTRQLQITGWCFLAIGIVMLIACGLLQRKNWVRYMDQMDNDLYFLKLGSNPVWNLMKLDLLDVAFYQKKLDRTDKNKHDSVHRLTENMSMPSPSDVLPISESSGARFNAHSRTSEINKSQISFQLQPTT